MEPRFWQTLLLGAAFRPLTIEAFLQLNLQARFLAALPSSTKAALPPHPTRPSLAFLGSPRFHVALWRYVRRDDPHDPDAVVALKREVRASLRRELVWSLGAVAVLAVLLTTGWRPLWP